MKDILLNCFYDNMSIKESVNFIFSVYGKKPSNKMIDIVKKEIKNTSCKDWE